MNENCEWLHHILEPLPMYGYPYRQDCIPPNGIYFMYEVCEAYSTQGNKLRITRVGSHTGQGNLPKRLGQHFSPADKWMNFRNDQPKASDRSIFRKHIGRAMLNRICDPYLEVWEIDFTEKNNRMEKKHLRDIDKEHSLEKRITEWIRNDIGFKFILVDDKTTRCSLEGHCISTIAYCKRCHLSSTWLGSDCTNRVVSEAGIWNDRHVSGPGIDTSDKKAIEEAVAKTLEWLKRCE